MKNTFPKKFEVLAIYNAEVYRGLLHTDRWKLDMMRLQREYDAWLDDYYRRMDARNAIPARNQDK